MLKERAKTSGSVGVCRVSGTEKTNVLILGPQNEQIMRESSLFTRCWSAFLLCDCCDDR